MSHFTVAVITKGKPTEAVLSAMLAPYDENKEVLHYTSREDLIKQSAKSSVISSKATTQDTLLIKKSILPNAQTKVILNT